MADGGLGDEAPFGSTAEAEFLADDEKILELAKVHTDILLMSKTDNSLANTAASWTEPMTVPYGNSHTFNLV
jgi:hypothetical protein